MRLLPLLLLVPFLALGQAFTFQDIPFLSQGATDWANRVVANGGDMPSPNTVRCMETLRQTLISQGITNKIHSLCVFVPDSVIAATTPLFKHKGIDPWGNSNFVSGDLTVQGLKGDGSTKSLNPGISNQQAATNGASIERGQTVIISESATNQNSVTMGWQDTDATPRDFIQISSNGFSSLFMADNVGSQNIVTNDFARVGYYSGNLFTNGSGTNITIYVASTLEAHKILSTQVRLNALGVPSPAIDLSVFARNNGTNSLWSAQRLSVAMVNAGFSETESSNVWVALRTCRECLGGGTGDPVHDWNKRVVANGGTDVSVTTSNALRTFYSGLDTDGLLYKMVFANMYPPDNLTAARTPLIWQSGNDVWTNVDFGTTNLTINGLAGNVTTKYLGTGVSPGGTVNRGFTEDSAGISLLIYSATNTGAGSLVEYGAAGSGANTFFALQHFAARINFYCWGIVTVNANFLSAPLPAPGSNWSGYISGNRTAANAFRIDLVTNGVHNIATNGTGAKVQVKTTITNTFAHAAATLASAPGNWSDRTVSFLSLHSGLTQTQSSNLWNRVRDYRTAIGGGGVPP